MCICGVLLIVGGEEGSLVDMPEMVEGRREVNLMEFGRASFCRMVPMALSNDEVTFPRFKLVKGADSICKTNISELPGAVLNSIFSLVSDPRTRNCMSLACREWYYLERQTRSSLTLRGNLCNLPNLPLSFGSVRCLDLSHCSPWGYSIFQTTTGGELIGQMLQGAFPNVKDLAIYVRDAVDIRMVAWLWPGLETIRLVRWHQRSTELGAGLEIGSEVEPLRGCQKLRKLDLSEFYCWTEDILPALDSGTASNLRSLNLLKLSPEGFKTQEIGEITAVCQNLEELYVLCEFDPRFVDSVGDRALEFIAMNCPRMRVLHLVDNNEWGATGSDRDDGAGSEDATVSCQGLEIMARKLPLLQNLALLLAQNVWDSRQGLEALLTNCRKLTSLQLSHFHGVCSGPEEDGLAMGINLRELSIKRSVDLSDLSLAYIARGCKNLKKLSLIGCREISERGVNTFVRTLSRTLVDVEILCCAHLPSVETLRALEPIRSSILRLHFDCVWDDAVVAQQAAAVAAGKRTSTLSKIKDGEDEFLKVEGAKRGFSLNFWQTDDINSASLNLGASNGSSYGLQQVDTADSRAEFSTSSRNGNDEGVFGHRLGSNDEGGESSRDRRSSSLEYRPDDNCPAMGISSDTAAEVVATLEQAPDQRCWKSLQTLSLWIGVGVLMSPLSSMGLGQCPALSEVTIKVEGDCKSLQRPAVRDWGLATLSRYKRFTKLNMDLGEVVSFSLSAPEGQLDLSIWERHYLSGIAELELRELNYRPPCDKDLNHRGLSLPAVGHLSQCLYIRKLIVHGSAHEHFLSMLQRNTSLRDFQLRWDFYPAPEYETSNEVRVEACRRFEEALAERGFPD